MFKLGVLFVAIFITFSFSDCTTLRKSYRTKRTDISFSDFSQGKYAKQQKILIKRLALKPTSFLSFSKDNLTENLRYSLLNQGFQIEIADEELFEKNKKTEPSLFTKEIASQEIPKDLIKEILQKSQSELLLEGYLYEKELGNVLDQDYTTGIVIKIYNGEGNLIGEAILGSYYPSADFEVNQMYAQILAEKIAGAYLPNKLNWKFPFLK